MLEGVFRKVAPEEIGIPSVAIQRFVEKLDSKFCLHGVMIVRNGKLVVESYWEPFSADLKHRMYSITKSFTAIAIGMLEQEKKLRLDDKVVSFFTDLLPAEGAHPYIAQATIRDLLCMATPHKSTTYRLADKTLRSPVKWLETFFTVEPDHMAGTAFHYDTSGAYVLAALVERVSGKKLLDYMRPGFLNKIGFSQDAYCMASPEGISHGGSSLVCTLQDLARFAWICMHDGKWNGEQILPPDFVRQATSFQISTQMENRGIDTQQGYGYYFWRCRHNGFVCYGMGGQLAVCLPDQDLMVLTLGDTQADDDWYQAYFDTIWEELCEQLSDKPLPTNQTAYDQMTQKLCHLSLKTVQGSRESCTVDAVNGKLYKMAKGNVLNLETVRFLFERETGIFTYQKHGIVYHIHFGLGHSIQGRFPEYPEDCVTSAAWMDDNSFYLVCYVVGDNLGTVRMQASFRGDRVTIQMKKAAEDFLMDYQGFASGQLE